MRLQPDQREPHGTSTIQPAAPSSTRVRGSSSAAHSHNGATATQNTPLSA